MPSRLHAVDLGVVGIYLVAITAFGLQFSRRSKAAGTGQDKSLRGYFLANRTIPWWAIALSIVSAETSTLTIIGTPGLAFAGDFGFLQIVFGYMLGRVVVAALFLPKYFQGEMLTAYQLIDRRFGKTLHKVTAGLFLLTRAAAEGVRVFAVSIVVGIAIGTGDVLSIAIISALTLLYTFEGGMAAVIWTDVVQMAIYVGGTIVAIGTLGGHVPGGWAQIHAVGAAAGKFHLLNFAMNLTTTYTFWAGVLGGTFLTMASHGTDQLMVQRMLAAKNLKESRVALLSSGVVIFVQFAMFLLIGVGLFVFYGLHPGGMEAAQAAGGNRIFPMFIVQEMPVGIAGLLVAAILAAAMSNLSAALNSLSSTTVVDFYMGWRPEAEERERMLVSRASTVVWALVLFGVAVYSVKAGGKGNVVEIGLSIASVAYGCLLGVFLLGTLTRYATQGGAIVGMVVGFAVNLALWQFPGKVLLSGWLRTPVAGESWSPPPTIIAIPRVAFTWYVLIGAVVTFGVGLGASVLLRGRKVAVAVVLVVGFVLTGKLVAQETKPISQGLKPRLTQPLMSGLKPGPISEAKAGGISPVSEAKAGGISPVSEAKAGGIGPVSEAKVGGIGRSVDVYALVAQTVTNPTSDVKPSDMGHPGSGVVDFSGVSATINGAIAEKKLPGIVAVVGHGGRVVFEQAYGVRKYAGEPGVDGKPSPAEAMTLDTIFDMASLTKCLATATAVMQLVEQGKVNVDAPVVKYLPEFGVNGKAGVTVRELLTHYSGLPPDVDLKDAWGLAKPDKAEGIKRAMEAKLESVPGTKFVYSDVNFITLGAIVEKMSGERLDVYAAEHIFGPLKMMHTRYLAFDKACSEHHTLGAAVVYSDESEDVTCSTTENWSGGLILEIAPTQHDNEGTAETNPDFDHLLRGTVHDPTTRRMGGVAGHAGVFSTARDVALFAQALLDRLAGRPSDFPLKRETLELMTRPEQPKTALGGATVFTADGKPTMGVAARGFGWDINSAFSRPRGEVLPIGSFGHTGFTGTSLWMDPGSDTYVVLLANSVHPRGNAAISPLRGVVATEVARALGVGGASPTHRDGAAMNGAPEVRGAPSQVSESRPGAPDVSTDSHVLTGIDVLEADGFAELKAAAARHGGKLRVGLLTNQTGLDAKGRRTIDVLRGAGNGIELRTLFSPEHGIFGAKDSTEIGTEVDAASGLKVTGLYGAKDADKRPKVEDLKDLDAVVVDLQDAGVRFYTYETVMGYFLEADACERANTHDMEVIVLDRPDLIGGEAVQGPVSNYEKDSYINYVMPVPVRHGMTIGEVAQYFSSKPNNCPLRLRNPPVVTSDDAPKMPEVNPAPQGNPDPLKRRVSDRRALVGHMITDQLARLTVVPMQGWKRDEFFDQTGVPWVNPSPNLRSVTEAVLYPGVGLMDATNMSVGRGTAMPFEVFGAGVTAASASAPAGAQWFDGKVVGEYLTARKIPGVSFNATKFAVAEDANKYPYHGQTIEGVKMTVTDRVALDSPEMGIEIVSALHHLYPAQFKLAKVAGLVANTETMAGLERGDDPRVIAAGWGVELEKFKERREHYLIYK